MVGLTNFDKIFKGRRCLSDTELRKGLVSGGVVALAERLRNAHGWDGVSLLAAPIMVLEAGGIADSHWAVWNSCSFDSLIALHIKILELIMIGTRQCAILTGVGRLEGRCVRRELALDGWQEGPESCD